MIIRNHTAALLATIAAGLVIAFAGVARAQTSSWLDNGIIKVGVDLSRGGAIYWISSSGSTYNVINRKDAGRYIQQSYYSGPTPFGNPATAWANWPWNPIAAGDFYGNRSDVIAQSNDGQQIYTKTIPRQWALNNVNGGCTFEQWITLDGTAAKMHCKLNNVRAPGKKPKLFIFAGQSNMVGVGDRNTLTTQERQALSNVKIFIADPSHAPPQPFNNGNVYWNWLPPNGEFANYTPWGITPNDAWNAMNPGHWPCVSNSYGPEFTTARDIANSLGETIYVVKYALGGSSLYTGSTLTWNVATADSPSNPEEYRLSLYHTMLEWTRKALAAARQENPDVQLAGIFWMQGESDAMNATTASAYQNNFNTFVKTLRSDLGEPGLPFIFGKVPPAPLLSSTIRQTVVTAQTNVDNADPLAAMVDTDDLPVNTTDNIHFTDASLKTLGQRFAQAWLSMNQSNTAQYGAFDQELPAVYTIGTLYKLYTYVGQAPFTNDALTEIDNSGPPWDYWSSTENWAAQVTSNNWGLGVYQPGNVRFAGGFAGTKGSGGPTNSSTGYIAPVGRDILDYNIGYEYDVTFILGNLDDIRSYVYQHQPASTEPNYKFTSDRQRCYYVNASDAGWPIEGRLQVKLDSLDPQIICPESFWPSASAPKVYVKMALSGTNQTACQVFFRRFGESDFVATPVTFTAVADGQMHTYEVNLASSASYTGNIAQLRLDPASGGVSGAYASVEYIATTQPEESAVQDSSWTLYG